MYRDRPRSEWHWNDGTVRMASDPIDIDGLMADAGDAAWTGAPAGSRIGHIHLRVGDIPAARAFYADTIGFAVTAQMPGALFVSAGGYHHHIGMNTWQSAGAPPAPAGAAGLRVFTIEVPAADLAAIERRLDNAGQRDAAGARIIDDPWGNRIRLVAGADHDAGQDPA